MPLREAKTSCRICTGVCALRLTIDENDHVVAIRGDKESPMTRGFACIKGLRLHDLHHGPDRLLHPLKRQPDGSFARIDLDTALDEIAAKLRELIDAHGAESIATFRGTANYQNLAAYHMLPAWMAAIGSNSFFSTLSIDQSAKWVTAERLGAWGGGLDAFGSADAMLMIGTNPLVSLGTAYVLKQDPVKHMRDAKARGLKLAVIDPRRTETARHADVLLQPLPGEDVTVVAGLLNIVFQEGWHDAEFCARYVSDLDGLMSAVAAYTPDYVARRADVPVQELYATARLFAEPVMQNGVKRRKRGIAVTGTAGNMGPHSNLVEHLVQCLNVVCGRFARAGDPVANPGVTGSRYPRVAAVVPPTRSWESGWHSRVDGTGMIFGEKMSGTMAQEILTPGPGQVRAMFVVGGNPVNALPDQKKIVAAFRDLELLVAIDPFMSNTARLAHYIIPPRMMFERSDLPSRDFESFLIDQPYAQYTPAVISPPPDAEVVDEWYVFWALARRLGKTLNFDGVPLEGDKAPTTDDLLAILCRNSPVPLEEIKRYPSGHIFDTEPMEVQPAGAGDSAKFDVIPADVKQELESVWNEVPTRDYPFRLAVRRLREVMNTWVRDVPAIRRVMPRNAAYLNPEDMAALNITSGMRVSITSAHGRIEGVAEADETLRRGVISISHGWGGLPDDAPGDAAGVNINLILSAEQRELINAMPVMTGVPVDVMAVA